MAVEELRAPTADVKVTGFTLIATTMVLVPLALEKVKR